MVMTPARMLLQTERWFVRYGVPTVIEGYSFSRHVLPRMLPALTVVAIASAAWLVPLRAAGARRWVLLAAVIAATVVVWSIVSLFVRRTPRFSPVATTAVLVGYAAMPVVVPLLQLTVEGTVTPPGGRTIGILGFVIFFVAAFVATLVATTYSLGRLLRQAVQRTVFDLRNSLQLLGRALPMLLFATLFLFFTGELWQAMDRLPWWRLALVVGLFAVVTVLAAAARLRDEIGRVEQDLSSSRLATAVRGTPLARLSIELLTSDGSLRPVPLTGRQQRNLLLMLGTRQLMQAAVVGLALYTFFVVLGLIVVTPETAEQWIGSVPQSSPMFPGVPIALLRNATLFGGFGSMYFAVTSMSDAEHRQRFYAPIIDEIERLLAVRAAYLAVRADIASP